MATLPDLQAELATLNVALGRGITRVTENGRTIEMDPRAMRARRTDVLAEIASLQAVDQGVPIVRRVYTFTSKGL